MFRYTSKPAPTLEVWSATENFEVKEPRRRGYRSATLSNRSEYTLCTITKDLEPLQHAPSKSAPHLHEVFSQNYNPPPAPSETNHALSPEREEPHNGNEDRH
ncbi:hypothetical protein M758_10G082300 [Ceratodon purpureus]|uniref:Uncharacterized protein n=1 Tax=Ceratodon purpureus TaxID=3225 RepID=A0A8T0GKT0_CERPU|nr:hypothetical protein KC19_10G083700 [Ceratodon purpureus]KAG0603297.1 hypothetical protein M758_10G082300 [Ceratodon purpureus]